MIISLRYLGAIFIEMKKVHAQLILEPILIKKKLSTYNYSKQ